MGLAVACSDDGPGSMMGSNQPLPAGTTAPGVTAGTPAAGAAGMATGMAGRPSVAGSSGAGRGAAGTPPAGTGGAGTGAAGMPPAGGGPAMAGTGAAGMMPMAGMGTAGMPTAGMPEAGTGGMKGAGMCCADGDCVCRDEPPASLVNMKGKYSTKTHIVQGVGCIHYPTDAEPPFSAVAVSDGFVGTGGCNSIQTGGWGPLMASWGIATMIIDTGGGDQPNVRGRKLTAGIAAFKSENMKSGSPLMGKLNGRYGTAGFSMGGGGTTYSSQADATLKSSVAIMPWGPVRTGVKVPTLVICGSSDGIASCSAHGNGAYAGIDDSIPKMRVTVSGGHNGQPSAGGGKSGEYGLAFMKLFLDGDERWKPLLAGADSNETNIE